nr:MAG TPA: hypothetical protein [Caudoviricetes sp.]
MLHAYITSYEICFMATVVIIMLLLIAGVEMDKEEAERYGAEVEPPPTAKEWIGCICKAFLIAFVVSFAAPIVLIFYIFTFGCIVLSALTDDHY